jgi:hypothetical protein
MDRTKPMLAALVFSAAAPAVLAQGFNSGLPAGWTCVGNCGTLGADGDVTLSGLSGSTAYGYVSTFNGADNGKALSPFSAGTPPGLLGGGIGEETNGSRLRSASFAAAAGDSLDFRFNYISSDGTSSFIEYAWALVRDASDMSVEALLFTGRTNPDGPPVPAFGLPATQAVVNGGAAVVMQGTEGPTWSQLGSTSGACFGAGCGFTGWLTSQYTFAAGGNFVLEFGAINWGDRNYDNGLAFDGITVAGVPIEEVPTDPGPITPAIPEPSTYAMMIAGLGMVSLALRRRKRH